MHKDIPMRSCGLQVFDDEIQQTLLQLKHDAFFSSSQKDLFLLNKKKVRIKNANSLIRKANFVTAIRVWFKGEFWFCRM